MDYAGNKSHFNIYSGNAEVTVCSDGTVKISLSGITNRQTGKNIGAKTFEVYYGTFGNQTWSGDLLTRITTDANGNFSGKINAKISPPVTKSFVLNSDGRSQFIAR